jgi:hypothetical protein
MAKEFQKTKGVRIGMFFMGNMLKLGIGGKGMYILSVRDEQDGGVRSNPVTLVENTQGRWLVAPYGITRWVRNARSAGEVQLRRGRLNERLRVVEVPPDEAAPVLREYVQRVATVRPYFDVAPDAPVDAFEAEAAAHPVFRLEPGL